MKKAILVLTLGTAVMAFAGEAGTSTAAFLKIGVGARAVGMGEAAAAVTTGPEALYWNPAGLAATERRAVSFTHNEWLEDIRYEYLGAAAGLPRIGAVALSAGYVGMGKLEGRDEQGQPTGDFSASDLSAAVGYGRQLWPFLAAGLAAQYISSDIEDESASTFAGTAGVLATLPFVKGLSLGAAVANVGGEMKFIEEGDPLPMVLRGGAGYLLPFGGENNQVTVAVDGVKYSDSDDINAHAGAEYVFMHMVAARLGYKANYDVDGLTGGLGVRYAPTENVALNADYAYADMGETFGATHRVTVGVGF